MGFLRDIFTGLYRVKLMDHFMTVVLMYGTYLDRSREGALSEVNELI